MRTFIYLAFLCIPIAHAQTWEESQGCPEARTQLDLNACATSVWKESDSTLEKFEADYIKRLTPEQRSLYQSTHLAWLNYREAACRFESSGVLGGSAYSMVFADCMGSKAKIRLLELRALAKCSEGDLACPVGDG